MQDPVRENIDGSKVERHVFKHSVDWGHIAIGIGLLAVAAVVWRATSGEDDDEDQDGSEAVF
jgi:hypothetical protein